MGRRKSGTMDGAFHILERKETTGRRTVERRFFRLRRISQGSTRGSSPAGTYATGKQSSQVLLLPDIMGYVFRVPLESAITNPKPHPVTGTPFQLSAFSVQRSAFSDLRPKAVSCLSPAFRLHSSAMTGLVREPIPWISTLT